MKKRGFFGYLCILFLASESYGSIMDVGAMGARSAGMGSTMVAVADDVISAFYYNPAGLTQIEGSNIAMGGLYAAPKIHYEGKERKRGYDETNSRTALIPFFGYCTDTLRPVVLGMGMYSTLGVGFGYDKDRDHGVKEDIKSVSGVMFLSPAIAWRVNPRFSLGLELNAGYAKSEIDQPTPLGYLKTEADGLGYGATIGLLYKLTPSLTLGLDWRSSMKTLAEGEARLVRRQSNEGDVKTRLYWPQMLTLGVAYKPLPRLTLAFDVKWSDWSYIF